MKQLAVAVAQYTQDYDESFPQAWAGAGGQNFCWWQELWPYVKNTQVFSCPSDSNKTNGGNSFAGAGPAQGYPSGLFHISYGANYPMFGNGGSNTVAGFNLADMPKPSMTVMMCDTGITSMPTSPYVTTTVGSKGAAWLLCDPTCDTSNAAKPCNTNAAGNPGSSTDTNWSAANPRHLETVNVAFADGHVKALKTLSFYYADSNWLNPRKGGP